VAAERLQKVLSNAGVASRRAAEEMILSGRISVNGVIVHELGARADPETDEILADGVPVSRAGYRYFMLNKPPGFVTTASDERGRETVLDLVPIGDIRLHPVGRLDAESEGLLLLTNDGNLTSLLTHPRYEVEKEYLAGIDAPLGKSALARLVRGIESDGERLRAVSAQMAAAPADAAGEAAEVPAWVLIVLRQGRKREVRRMLAALGRKVVVLRRVRLGPLRLGALGHGAFRELTDPEVLALYAAAHRARQSPGMTDPRPGPRSA
jgi:23S rRNA pseudouridine2605 synthase